MTLWLGLHLIPNPVHGLPINAALFGEANLLLPQAGDVHGIRAAIQHQEQVQPLSTGGGLQELFDFLDREHHDLFERN
jgi:hypothetical protein